MDLVAADPWGGSWVLADDVTSGGSDTVYGGHGDSSGARARGTAGGGDEGWEVRQSLPGDDIFVPLAVETYGCLDSAFDGLLGTCARRATELRARGLGSVPMASRLISYYRSRVLISLQSSQARAIHHRAARAVQSLTGLTSVDGSGWFCSIGRFVP
jgi:hypothetical protein